MTKFLKIFALIFILPYMIIIAQDYEARSTSQKLRIQKNPPKINVEIQFNKPVSNNILKGGDINDFQITITNTGKGPAKDVYVDLRSNDLGNDVLKIVSTIKIGNIEAGETKTFTIPFTVNPTLNKPINGILNFYFSEKGEYELSKQFYPIKIVPNQEKSIQQEEEIILASDVDKNIPVSPFKRPNAIALVLTVSKYANKDIPAVKFAKHDGKAIREYLVKTFGYDPDNILPKEENTLITYGTMKNFIKNVLPNYLRKDGSSELFVYFAGHGAPNVNTKKAYFVPYDADPNYVSDENAYSMEAFYDDLGALKAKSKIVVIDACFSGASGEGELIIKNASPVLLDVEENTGTSLDDTANVVFKSSTGQQVSNWYPEKNHGMFTYYFLKGIQGAADKNNDGIITVGEIKNYINDENEGLTSMALRKYGRKQTAVISGKDDNVLVRLK
jgi:hypothetical protein